MPSASRCCGLVCFLIVLAMLFLSGCGSNEINVSVAQNKKVVLNPGYGDVIKWKGVNVHFLVPFCKETDLWTPQCTVNVQVSANQFGQYNYICQSGGCSDPEVDVGSGNGNPLNKLSTTPTDAQTDQVGLACSSGVVTAGPSDVPDSLYSPVAPGTIVQWIGNGLPVLTDWTVKFDDGNSTVCGVDTIQAGGNDKCTIQQELTAGKAYKYSATSTSMCATAGSGTVTIPK
jgi:hypothetical protein